MNSLLQKKIQYLNNMRIFAPEKNLNLLYNYHSNHLTLALNKPF